MPATNPLQASPLVVPLQVQLGAPPHGFPGTAKAVPLRFTFPMPPSASVPATSCAGLTAAVLQAYGDAKLSVDAAPRLVAPLLYFPDVSSRVTANVASAREAAAHACLCRQGSAQNLTHRQRLLQLCPCAS